MVIPSPFTAPPGMGPSLMPGVGAPTSSPIPPATPPGDGSVLALIEAALAPPYEPVYPPGYVVPRRPKITDIVSRAEAAKQAYGPWLDHIADTLNRVRGLTRGYLTSADILARRNGQQQPFPSTALVDSWNRFVAYLASLPIAYSLEEYDPELTQAAQQIEDACYYFRKQHERRWVARGNMPLAQAEAKDLTLYGMIVSRRTCNLNDPKCPIEATLQDPTTIFPVIGRVGSRAELTAVYQVRKVSVYELLADYTSDGDLPKRIKDAVGNKIGTFDETNEVEVVEYWDDWWRSVVLLEGNVEIMPVTAHEYGCVPYVIQYGPGGESLHTRSPDQTWQVADASSSGGPRSFERIYKARGFIDPMKDLHDLREGISAKIAERFLRDLQPPLVLSQSQVAADVVGDPEINREEGGVTKLIGGEETIGPLPEAPLQSGALSLLMQIVGADTQTNIPSPAFMGVIDKSNVSGTAQSVAAEQGREQEAGWVMALESYHGRCASHDLKLWRNFGHESRYQDDGDVKTFYVPTRNRMEGSAKAYELTPEIIDSVDVECMAAHMNSLRMSELPLFAQVAQQLGPMGLQVWDIYDIARKMGKTDVDRSIANNRAHMAIQKAQELPEFAKAITIPQAFLQAIAQAEGNPELQATLQAQLEWWVTMIAQPQEQQMQAAANPQPPQGPPGGPPQPGQGIAGGAGAPYQQLGMGPGSEGGAVGRPEDQPPPPPPGSFRIA